MNRDWSRRSVIVLLTVFLGLLVFAMTAKGALAAILGLGNLEPHRGDGHTRVLGRGQIRFDGAGPERWALRFRRERELTQRLLRRLAHQRYVILHRRDLASAVPSWLSDAFMCIHSHEGAWDANTGNGYYGGLQFGYSEWQRFGGRYAARADLASPAEQIAAAVSYWHVAGFAPWPNTARMCGLR